MLWSAIMETYPSVPDTTPASAGASRNVHFLLESELRDELFRFRDCRCPASVACHILRGEDLWKESLS
jgi:hypothetical protein